MVLKNRRAAGPTFGRPGHNIVPVWRCPCFSAVKAAAILSNFGPLDSLADGPRTL